MEKNKNIFAAPVFEDEEKSRNAYLLNFVTISYFLISFSAIIAAFFASTDMEKTLSEVLIRSLPVLVVLLIAQILMRLGKVRTAGLFLGVLLWLTTAFNVLISGGASSSSLYVFIVVVMIFGLLGGRVYAIVSAIASFIMAIVALILETQGLLPASISAQDATTDMFTYFVVIFLSTSLLYLYRMRLDESVDNLRQANADLEQAGIHLEQQVTERTLALEISTEVSRRLSTILDQDQLVREVVEQLRTAFGYYHAQIYLFDEHRQNLVMAGGTGDAGRALLASGHTLEKGQGLVGRSAERNQVILIPDVAQAEGWLANPLLPDTKAEVAVPIVLGDDVIGVLDVQHNLTDGLSERDADLIQSIANQVAIAVQNAQAFTHSQQQAVREAQITAINQRIQSAMTIEDVLQIAVSELGNTLGARISNIDLQVTALSPDERI